MLFHRILAAAGLAALLAPTLVASEEEGPAERAGRALDEAAGDARERLEKLGKDEGPLEKAGRKADEALDEARKAVAE
jgi:hypothetical protein